MDAKTLFNEQLPKLLEKEPDKARELDAIYLFTITGDNGGTWTVDVKSESPSIKEGDEGNADCSIELTSEDFQAMLADPQVGMQLYFQGKLKVSGNPMLATKLQQLFQMGGLNG